MPGHFVPRGSFKDSDAISRFSCHECQLLLKDPVQLACGHRICMSCADAMLLDKDTPPQCPEPGCGEDIHDEDGRYYFPDRFVRRQINNLVVSCPFSELGCNWEGKFEQFYNHHSTCGFQNLDLFIFPINASPTQSLNRHELVGLQAPGIQCPLHTLGCSSEIFMKRDELQQHLKEDECYHLKTIANHLQLLTEKIQRLAAHSQRTQNINFTAVIDQRREPDPLLERAAFSQLSDEIHNLVADEMQRDVRMLSMQRKLQTQDEEMASLKSQVMTLEKQIRLRNAELEDRDFRLSLIENSNHDGSMIWKIPEFSQRKADAQNGKYTSIFSPPFYTGQYGYKMCLRLYIMGDGTGKGTHLSLFFVIMKGEYDNILQWPFAYKVTFKLINQAGGRNLIDTFQPDPMSSSFKKPKSDMNIASGCPKFVHHDELESRGFIVDDTIFIKCAVDTSTIFHP